MISTRPEADVEKLLAPRLSTGNRPRFSTAPPAPMPPQSAYQIRTSTGWNTGGKGSSQHFFEVKDRVDRIGTTGDFVARMPGRP